MTTPHIMFRDDSGKLHPTPALALAADLGGLLGSVIRVEGTSATVWSIEGTNEGTATMTTAFTSTP